MLSGESGEHASGAHAAREALWSVRHVSANPLAAAVGGCWAGPGGLGGSLQPKGLESSLESCAEVRNKNGVLLQIVCARACVSLWAIY
jgi:hypothetical protein